MRAHGDAPLSIYKRRFAYTADGIVASIWVVGCAIYALLNAGSAPRRYSFSNPDPNILFLFTGVVWVLAYAVARAFARRRFEVRLERTRAARTNAAGGPPEAVVRAIERIELARSMEQSAVSWPLIALVLGLPLSLRAFGVAVVDHFGSDAVPIGLATLSDWLASCFLFVGHVHFVCALYVQRAAVRLETKAGEDRLHAKGGAASLDRDPKTGRAESSLSSATSGAYVWTAAVSILSGAGMSFAIGRPEPVIFAATIVATVFNGLLLFPLMRRMQRRMRRERSALEHALLAEDESAVPRAERLIAAASWKQGPESLRVLALQGLAESGQRNVVRPLIDQLFADAPPRVRHKLLSLAFDLYHRPPNALLLDALATTPDPASLALICKLLGMSRDRASEPALIELLVHPLDEVVITAAEALSRCGTIACVEPLSRLKKDSAIRRHRVAIAAEDAIATVQASLDPNRARGQLSVVENSAAGAVSVAEESGTLSVAR